IVTADQLAKTRNPLGNCLERRSVDDAVAGQTCACINLHQHETGILQRLLRSPQRLLDGHRQGMRAYCCYLHVQLSVFLMPAVLITRVHFAISERRYCENHSGVLATTSKRCSLSLLTVSDCARTLTNAVLSLAIMSFGVPEGASKPCHAIAS